MCFHRMLHEKKAITRRRHVLFLSLVYLNNNVYSSVELMANKIDQKVCLVFIRVLLTIIQGYTIAVFYLQRMT